MSDHTETATTDVGQRTNCWECGHCWDGWRSQNPEGMPCLNCGSDKTRHVTKSQARVRVMERLGLYLEALATEQASVIGHDLRELRRAYRYALGQLDSGSSDQRDRTDQS